MHITGIVESKNTQEILDTIKYFLGVGNKKVSFTEYDYRFKYIQKWKDYCSALNQVGTDILMIKIKPKDLEAAIKDLVLDTLIVNDYYEWNVVLSQLRNDTKSTSDELTVILNNDIVKTSQFTSIEGYRVLGYGFNKESIITTSSTGEPSISGQFLCCITSSLISANGKKVEPQEYVMSFENSIRDPYNVLVAASFAVLHDINLNKINDKITEFE
ncbi:MAG: hypothetical protein GX283_05920 [Clostridiaceae bacterium]|nr:hypothetical protein [Clostridiaceae bacterium]